MFVLDTDTFTHLVHGHERVALRRSQVTEEVVLTAVTRIEVLQGRFASVMKAEDAEQLLLAQQRLAQSERQLASFDVLPVDAAAAAEFERLLGAEGVRRVGRGGPPLCPPVLAEKAAPPTPTPE